VSKNVRETDKKVESVHTNMCYVDPHSDKRHGKRECDRAERPLIELDDERAVEYGFHTPCPCI